MKRNKLLLCSGICVILILFLGGTGCEVKQPAYELSPSPQLSELVFPDTLNIQDPGAYAVTVRAVDPQGPEDIAFVLIRIDQMAGNAAVHTDTLQDLGLDGDIIPRDGIYFGRLSAAFSQDKPGDYLISAEAADLESNGSNVLTDTLMVVDYNLSPALALSNITMPPSISDDNLEFFQVSARISDPAGLETLDSVWVEIYPPLSPAPRYMFRMLDNGFGSDAVAGDGIFSVGLNLKDYTPRLRDPVAPAEVSRNSSESILLAVTVSDSNGPADIRAVYFNSYKPNNVPATGNPFEMFDDGDQNAHGDEEQGDGIYSRTVSISPSNMLGDYRFEFIAADYEWTQGPVLFRFMAVDTAGDISRPVLREIEADFTDISSDTLIHYMTVVN